MSTDAAPSPAAPAPADRPAPALAAGERVAAIDVMRGFVIALMALDHVRDYLHTGGFGSDPLDPATTTPAIYATRWASHLCAPTFVLLAGVSAYLQLAKGKAPRRLSRFLLTRGLWLIVLEITAISFAWSFAFPYPFFLQVIWAIGWSMIALSALVWLPPKAVLAIGVAIVAGHNLLDPLTPRQFGSLAPLWKLLHEGGLLGPPGTLIGFVGYPIFPWVGVITLGYGLGPLFAGAPERRDRALPLAGTAMLAAFALLRGFNLYGNPPPRGGAAKLWQAQPDSTSALMVFLDVQKYPPSLQFVLATLGAAFLLWPLLARLRGPIAAFFGTFGAVPLFFYVPHVFVVHLLALAANAAAGRDVRGMFNFISNSASSSPLMKGLGFPLWAVYLAWAAVLALFYPACRWWRGVKARRRDWWLSYLLLFGLRTEEEASCTGRCRRSRRGRGCARS